MMAHLPFYIVDVFAEEKYAGNQLAVVLDTGHLSTEAMQRIAKEINYSETTFITALEPRSGGYDVRIFTPAQELPFAGHPTLGTAFVIQQTIAQQAIADITLNLPVGPIPVQISYRGEEPEVLWMQQPTPTFGPTVATAAMAQVLGLTETDFADRCPIQAVSTGVPFLIVPLKTLAALQRIQINLEQLSHVVASLAAKQILVFCPETRFPNNQLSVRVFCHALGIPEDPATGSANGCLAGYLAQYDYFGPRAIDISVEQGYEIGRPSRLLLRSHQSPQGISVAVGGQVVWVARGELV